MPEKIICDCHAIHSDVILQVRKEMPQKNMLVGLANFYKMFADGTRVQILAALEVREMCVCDLANLFNMTKSAISHQLKGLRLGNLVKYRKDGKVVYYSLADAHVKGILDQGLEHISE